MGWEQKCPIIPSLYAAIFVLISFYGSWTNRASALFCHLVKRNFPVSPRIDRPMALIWASSKPLANSSLPSSFLASEIPRDLRESRSSCSSDTPRPECKSYVQLAMELRQRRLGKFTCITWLSTSGALKPRQLTMRHQQRRKETSLDNSLIQVSQIMIEILATSVLLAQCFTFFSTFMRCHLKPKPAWENRRIQSLSWSLIHEVQR